MLHGDADRGAALERGNRPAGRKPVRICRFGYVEDMEVDLESGQVRSLVVPGRRRLFGLLGREEDRYIPWSSVCRFGEDIILVEQEPQSRPPRRRR